LELLLLLMQLTGRENTMALKDELIRELHQKSF
jgi:hypothetical protein